MPHVVRERIPRDPGRSLVCIDQDVHVFDCPFHQHPEIEIVRIDESRGRVLVGDGGGRFLPGDLYVLAGGLPHAFLNEPGTVRARSRCLQFDADLLEHAAEIWPEAGDLPNVSRLARRGVCLRGERAGKLSTLLNRLFTKDGPERVGIWLQILSVLPEPLESEKMASERYAGIVPDRALARLEPVLAHIHAHLQEELRVDDLAQQAGLSPSAFHRLFRSRMGCTPMAYLRDLRLSLVAHQLLETEKSIAEIAFEAGFNHLSHFNRQFRNQFTCSPREYRSRDLTFPANQIRFQMA